MSKYVWNGPGNLTGEEKNGATKNGDPGSKRMTLTPGSEIPDGFVDERSMKKFEEQGKISERTFIDKKVKAKILKEKEQPEQPETEQKEEKKSRFGFGGN